MKNRSCKKIKVLGVIHPDGHISRVPKSDKKLKVFQKLEKKQNKRFFVNKMPTYPESIDNDCTIISSIISHSLVAFIALSIKTIVKSVIRSYENWRRERMYKNYIH